MCSVAITDRETETAAAAEEEVTSLATAATVVEVAVADLEEAHTEDPPHPALTATFNKQHHFSPSQQRLVLSFLLHLSFPCVFYF